MRTTSCPASFQGGDGEGPDVPGRPGNSDTHGSHGDLSSSLAGSRTSENSRMSGHAPRPRMVTEQRHLLRTYDPESSTFSLSPVFETKTTRSLAGSVRLVFSVRTWWVPGGSTQFSPSR